MVGEIRDRDTADMAVQAALTGHLVLSTLHTNDAPTAITRLLDLGVPPYLINSTVIGVHGPAPRAHALSALQEARRAAGRRHLADADRALRRRPSAAGAKPVGCLECRMTGYYGRLGLYEIMTMTAPLRRLIHSESDDAKIRDLAYKEGMKPLRVSGAMKIAQGFTTPEEVVKVVPLL